MYVALGLMSGTSGDGIDAAILRTNGKYRLERGPSAVFPYDRPFRKRIARAMREAETLTSRHERTPFLAKVEREITERHQDAVERILADNGLRLSDIDLVGFHGQTVLHRPQAGLTVQLGSAQQLADHTGLRVVCDLRVNDMAHGGQGAPLACAYHRALARNLPDAEHGEWPVAFVNIGGIANITWISREGGMIAFDSGPGNVLIDKWMETVAGRDFDEDGATAASGEIVPGIVDRYLSDPYFSRPPPKSLDRGDFAPLPEDAASPADGARSLAHVTAASIVGAGDLLPEPPRRWIVSGGGSRNRVLMADLADLAAEAADGDAPGRVFTATELGFDSDMLEAEAWAYLAVRSARGLKITWPGTTGVSRAVSGGVLAEPAILSRAAG